ncbi:MAG TPA: histidine phosphatase family protein [Thermoleophilia bacterium]|nr:histidine phosphatase family protein [Thermoleophilia bacterium]HQG03593.1 histidine phosphatase family protein [Thermoleophilia bacterium]HQJ97644.1 histidine phosphatase family protein [Thermoleophilia bacterium]
MILLLRHGQTDWNLEPTRCQGWADVPLNETGRAQARDRGRALRGRGLDLVVTSHLTRARETADIVRAELATGARRPALIVDPRLAESDRGRWEARTFAEIAASKPETWRRYREHPEAFRFPGGETLVEQQRRVLGCLRDVALDGRHALLVTHGGSMRLVRCFTAGAGIAAFHEGEARNGMLLEVADDGLAERIERYLLGNAQAVEARTR